MMEGAVGSHYTVYKWYFQCNHLRKLSKYFNKTVCVCLLRQLFVLIFISTVCRISISYFEVISSGTRLMKSESEERERKKAYLRNSVSYCIFDGHFD